MIRTAIIIIFAFFTTVLGTASVRTQDNEPNFARYRNSLGLVRAIISSTASQDFADREDAYDAASDWHTRRLRQTDGAGAPYLACAEYGRGREALEHLQQQYGSSAVQIVSNGADYGACFIVTATVGEASSILDRPATLGLSSASPLLYTLKLAPGLLDHGDSETDGRDVERLRTKLGGSIDTSRIRGLTVKLSPGTLPASSRAASESLINNLRVGLLSKSLDLREDNFWSDAATFQSEALSGHRGIRHRVREWNRAASVVHQSADSEGASPGHVCNWARIAMYHPDEDLLLIYGFDEHMIPDDEGSSELQMACFMNLLSQLALRPEVLRVAAMHQEEPVNLVAKAITQSATIEETPLQDAGLDGTGEVVQVVDSGLDETHCFFADPDGNQVEHGYLFEGVREVTTGNVTDYVPYMDAPSFVYDLTPRKIVQYIELFKVPIGNDTSSDPSIDSFTYASQAPSYTSPSYADLPDSSFGYSDMSYVERFYNLYWNTSYCRAVREDPGAYIPALANTSSTSTTSSSSSYGFGTDALYGHGTHTAGTVAGATALGSPFLVQNCSEEYLPGCVGGCLSPSDADEMVNNGAFNIDTYCPAYDCDGTDTQSPNCLFKDDALQNLAEHSGVAPGAKLAIFDASYVQFFILFWVAGRQMFMSSMETGAKIHSNSYAQISNCENTEMDAQYDMFVYENPEHSVVVAAGNGGGLEDVPAREACTVTSPSLGKNVITVGSTSTGPSRASTTGTDGKMLYESLSLEDWSPEGYPYICIAPDLGLPSETTEMADIDTVSAFSSRGPAADGRIKPDVVAPGDQVFSAAAGRADDPGSTCLLVPGMGTSMATPNVAGSAALIRQYFKDPSFYEYDVRARELCGPRNGFSCHPFAPSGATVKAMLINSANLMGGSAEPDGDRGFGRVHLAAGMPINGDGDMALFVSDSFSASISSGGSFTYYFNINGNGQIDLRATLCWTDPPAPTLSIKQLVHDLDLTVTSPSGEVYTMWASGTADSVNVVERVIVPGVSQSGEWSVTVSAKELLMDSQPYSLVVTGPIQATDK